jgi:hypothetical protein
VLKRTQRGQKHFRWEWNSSWWIQYSSISIVWAEWDGGCLKLPKSSDCMDYYNLECMITYVWYSLLGYVKFLNRLTIHRIACRKLLKGGTVRSERHICTWRYALQLNSVPNIGATLLTVHCLRQNGTLNDCNLENWVCTMLVSGIRVLDSVAAGNACNILILCHIMHSVSNFLSSLLGKNEKPSQAGP